MGRACHSLDLCEDVELTVERMQGLICSSEVMYEGRSRLAPFPFPFIRIGLSTPAARVPEGFVSCA